MVFTPFLRAQLANRLPQPVNFRVREALEIDRFSEFITDISQQQKDEINTLALEIVKSNSTNDPIFEFRVEGHADIARTIPPQSRDSLKTRLVKSVLKTASDFSSKLWKRMAVRL